MHATGARSYNPDLGRWINRDPVEEKGGVNLMGFVGNGPKIFIDALGQKGFPETGFETKTDYNPQALMREEERLHTEKFGGSPNWSKPMPQRPWWRISSISSPRKGPISPEYLAWKEKGFIEGVYVQNGDLCQKGDVDVSYVELGIDPKYGNLLPVWRRAFETLDHKSKPPEYITIALEYYELIEHTFRCRCVTDDIWKWRKVSKQVIGTVVKQSQKAKIVSHRPYYGIPTLKVYPKEGYNKFDMPDNMGVLRIYNPEETTHGSEGYDPYGMPLDESDTPIQIKPWH